MNKLIARRFALQYFSITLLFVLLFYSLGDYYFLGLCKITHPIDEHVFRTLHFFDTDYVIKAKSCGYNHPRYFVSYFIVDMIFPLIYSAFFLSIIDVFKKTPLYKFFFILIIAGCLFDYMENGSIAVFLCMRGDGLAATVTFFTMIKSILFFVNVVLGVGCLGWEYVKSKM
ncbi:MAG: hypothetical protein QM737_23325 [Ferruginibacter sp.]